VIRVFLSLNALQIGGMGLSYLTVVYLARWHGTETLGRYMFLLNAVIVVGTLASAGMPAIVQRLGAQLDGTRIGPATWMVLRRRWPILIAMAGLGSIAIRAMGADQSPTLLSIGQLWLAALAFALTLVLVETTRIAKGPVPAEILRNVVRPVPLLALVIVGVAVDWAVLLSVLVALAAALAANFGTAGCRRGAGSRDLADVASYVARRSADLKSLMLLNATGLVVNSTDVVLFGLLNDLAATGVYGAAGRFAKLVNVALLSGSAQMVQLVAGVAENGTGDAESLALLRKQVRLVRLAATGLLVALFATLPVYAWILGIPVAELWAYFTVVALSFWLQSMLGPSDMFMVQTHQAPLLIAYNSLGLFLFLAVSVSLHWCGIALAVPMGAAVSANTVRLLSWTRIRRSHGISF
jgi:O-antigen/teichoic acid export membrane protein